MTIIKRSNEVAIYKTKGGEVKLEVNLRKGTVWLNLNQMAGLFGRDKSVISKHLSNIFKEKELSKRSTVANFATAQIEGGRQITRNIEYYDLDAIISVGYRVNSKVGTRFRIWATSLLKKHLIEGYTINERQLKLDTYRLRALQKTIKVMHTVVERKALTGDEAKSLLWLLNDYSYALGVLDDYDNKSLKIRNTTRKETFRITYKDAKGIIENIRAKFKTSDLFGVEKDGSFNSSIGTIYQTFDSQELYPSVEEKAANLLYLIVKNHSFVDGNKRIAASLFVWFLERNGILYRQDGTKRLEDNALVALTLMIAESKPSEHADITTLIVNLINRSN